MLAAQLMNATHVAAAVFSPTRNTCKKTVAPSRYRYEPYGARVLPLSIAVVSPVARAIVTSIAVPLPKAETPKLSMPSPLKAMPAASMVKPAGPRYTIVKFKYETVTFVAPFRIAVGDVVVVEGDRGENIGVVQEIVADKPMYAVNNKVLRRATDKDREALSAQRQREAAATKTTQALADNLGLHATIEDAEYQFDLNKLTIFVRRASKNAFVDFRKLQRGLFREFRCRIWCAYMDEVEAAEMGERTH